MQEIYGDFIEACGYQAAAVAGFDDIAMAQFLNPPLTTVRVDAYEEGKCAVQMLTAALKTHPARATTQIIPTQLVVRGSCGSRAPFEAVFDRRRSARSLSGKDEDGRSAAAKPR